MIAVAFNDGTLKAGRYHFPGNTAFLEGIDRSKFALQTLIVGGASQSKQVPLQRFDVLFNSICNPDIHHKTLELLKGFTQNLSCRIINAPAAVLQSDRENISKLLDGLEGLSVPRTIGIVPSSRQEVIDTIKEAAFEFPVLFRAAELHGGMQMVRIDGPGHFDLLDRFALDGRKYYLTQYVDYKSPDGLYRKSRFIVVGERVFARHHIMSRSWMVHADSRQEFIAKYPEYALEEERFIEAFPSRLAERCLAIKKRIGLDLFGIDAYVAEDGTLLIFEVNACMRYFGPRQHNYIDKTTDAITSEIEKLLGKQS